MLNKLGLLLLLALHGFLLYSWIKIDTRSLAWDEALHTNVALDYKDGMAKEGFSAVLKPAYFNYPPLYHLSLIPFLGMTKDITDAGAPVNFIFFCVMVLSVYFITKDLFGSYAAFSAALLVSCYPILVTMTRPPMIDLALTSLVSLGMCCLLKSKKFGSLFWSVLFGVTFALAQLTKWTAFIYFLNPVLWSITGAIKGGRVKTVLLSLLVSFVLLFPWYSTNFIPVLLRITWMKDLSPASGLHYPGIWNSFWYFFALIEQLNIFYFLLFLPGLVVVFWKPSAWPIYLWFLGSLFLMSLLGNKNSRYTMPALPAVAILSVAWLPSFRLWSFSLMNLIIVVVFSFFTFKTSSAATLKIGEATLSLFPINPTVKTDWQHGPIINRIDELRDPKKKISRVIVVANLGPFHSETLNVSRRISHKSGFVFRGPSKSRWLEFADFVLFKTGDLGPGFTLGTVNECAHYLTSPPEWFKKIFVEVARWKLADGGEAVLFQSHPKPMKSMDIGLLSSSFKEMTFGRIKAKGVVMKMVPISPNATAIGRFKEMEFKCQSLIYNEFEFMNVRIQLIDPQINLPLFIEKGQIQFLSLEKLNPTAILPITPVLEYAHTKLKWLKEPNLVCDGSNINVSGKVKGIPIQLSVQVVVQKEILKTEIKKCRLGGIPIPLVLLRAKTDQEISLTPTAEMPFYLGLKDIHGIGDKLILETN